MANPVDEFKAEIKRLQTQRDNIVFALHAADLAEEHRARLHAQLSSVEQRLVLLTGGPLARFVSP